MSKIPVFRHQYDGIVCEGCSLDPKSMTQQQFADEVNVNKIMERAERGNISIDELSTVRGNPIFGDFSEIGSFHEMHNRVLEAQEMFMTLPPKVREKFNGDPGELLDFVNNPDNKAQAIELGLIEPKNEVKNEPPPKKEEEKKGGDAQ